MVFEYRMLCAHFQHLLNAHSLITCSLSLFLKSNRKYTAPPSPLLPSFSSIWKMLFVTIAIWKCWTHRMATWYESGRLILRICVWYWISERNGMRNEWKRVRKRDTHTPIHSVYKFNFENDGFGCTSSAFQFDGFCYCFWFCFMIVAMTVSVLPAWLGKSFECRKAYKQQHCVRKLFSLKIV